MAMQAALPDAGISRRAYGHTFGHTFSFRCAAAHSNIEMEKQEKVLYYKAFLSIPPNVQNPISPLAAMRSGVRSP
ncbi:hypothetical protein B1748_10860 [Paenibacillus sp. MY03]|nr:hypothetical protein B1748_10860 [Paenibacillus sp. MY03]